MTMTDQAVRLKKAMQAAGFKYGTYRTGGDFTVRTEGSGSSPNGFGDAQVFMNGDARFRALLNAVELAELGVSVWVFRLDDGRMDLVLTSSWRGRGRVATTDYPADGGVPVFGEVKVQLREEG